jgi:hypothetical protein
MGEAERTEGAAMSTPPQAGEQARSPEEIRADIEQTREEVGDTVEALAEKTDVKAQVRERVETVKAKVRASTPASAQQGGQQVVTKARENPAPLVVGGAVLVAFLIGRRSARP